MGRVIILLVVAITLCEVAFSQVADSTTFLPAVVSTADNEFGSCFSNIGNSFYFARTVGARTVLLTTSRVNGEWTRPKPLAFCDDGFSYADPAFSPAGDLYFISNAPTSASDTTRDYNIWKTSVQDGKWQPPIEVPILNSAFDEYYISFTSNGDAYFASARPGGFGEEDLYVARWEQGAYNMPVNLGSDINTGHSEYDPFISADGNLLIFASSGRDDSFGKADLYWVRLDTRSKTVNHFDKRVNTPARDYCPYVSPDQKLFYSTGGDIKTYSTPLAHLLD